MDAEMQAIEKAMQLERDGHAFYLRAAERTASAVGRQTFLSLADDEQLHLQIFQRQHDALARHQSWLSVPEIQDVTPDWDQPLFPRDPEVLKKVVHPEAGDADALIFALQIEHQSAEFYRQQAHTVTAPAGQAMYRWLANVERGHFNQLMINYEAMTGYGS